MRQCRSILPNGDLAIVVVAKGLGRVDLSLGPERGPGPVLMSGQGHLGEIGTREARVPVKALISPGSQGVAVARTATTAATTTATGRMTPRRTILLRTPTKVRVLVSLFPLPLRKLGTHPSLLLLLCCYSLLWVLWLVGVLHWTICH